MKIDQDRKGESQTTTYSILKSKESKSNHLCSLEKSQTLSSSLIKKPCYLYLLWPGKNIFLFNGRLMSGPNLCYLVLVFFIFLIVCIPYFIIICSSLYNQSLVLLTVCALILCFYSFISYLLTTFMEPGILPRKIFRSLESENEKLKFLEASEKKDEENPIKWIKKLKNDVLYAKTITIIENKTKYYLNLCEICKIYKPPLTKHCK